MPDPTPNLGSGNPTPAPAPQGQSAAEGRLGSSTAYVQAPRVTLTIEFGSLSIDVIAKISTFVQEALELAPGGANVGAAGQASKREGNET